MIVEVDADSKVSCCQIFRYLSSSLSGAACRGVPASIPRRSMSRPLVGPSLGAVDDNYNKEGTLDVPQP